MKISLFGNYGATNIGDDAILSAILKSHPTHEFTVFSADPAATRGQFKVESAPLFPLGVRSFFKWGFKKSAAALQKTELAVLGGGGLFQDSRLFACFLWAWQVYWIQYYGKPLFIYATGVGPLKTWIGRKLTKWTYDYASGVTVRDKESYELLLELGVNPQKIEVTADPAFILSAPPAEEKTRQAHSYVVSLRPWGEKNQKLIETFTRYLLKLKADKNARFTFVCMQAIREHDRHVLGPLVKRVGGDLVAPKDFAELLTILDQAEFAIGMRYHFLIAALMTQTPTLALSYSPKDDSLYEAELRPYLIPISELSLDGLEKRMSRLSIEYNKFKLFAKTRAAGLSERALKNAGFLEDFIKTLTPPVETDKLTQRTEN